MTTPQIPGLPFPLPPGSVVVSVSATPLPGGGGTINAASLPIPQDAPVEKPKLEDYGNKDVLQQESDKAALAQFVAGLTKKKPKKIKRSDINADPDTVRVSRVSGRLVFRHLHPQDDPTIMVADPLVRGGWLCPSCGDEIDGSVAKCLSDDVKIEESATAFYEAAEKEYQETPVLQIGSKQTEFKMKLPFVGQTETAIKECLGKLAGSGHPICGYALTEEPVEDFVDVKAQIVTVFFEDLNGLYRFGQDKKTKSIYNRFKESADFKKLLEQETDEAP